MTIPTDELLEIGARGADPLGWKWYDNTADDPAHVASRSIFRNYQLASMRAAFLALESKGVKLIEREADDALLGAGAEALDEALAANRNRGGDYSSEQIADAVHQAMHDAAPSLSTTKPSEES